MVGTEIKFTIDNFSGIIDVSQWLVYMENNNYHYKDPKKKPHMVGVNIKGVYILYDKLKKPIYVGKSGNCIRHRLRTHLETKPKSIDYYDNLFMLYKRQNYKYFSFIETKEDLAPFLEQHLIKKYKPKFNIEYNDNFKYDKGWYSFLKECETNKENKFHREFIIQKKKEEKEQEKFKKIMLDIVI